MHDEGFKVVTTAKMIIDTVIDAAQVTTDVADIPISATDTMVTTTPIIKATKTIVKIILDDGDDVTIEAIPLSCKSPTIVDYKIHKEWKKHYFQIFRVDDRFEKIKPMDYIDEYLIHTLKTMFEHHIEENLWKNQQRLPKVKSWNLIDSCGVHCITL
nr:hypothetical protein [Tanacetum cinerariifolium]GEY72495.1 hypothetical protein [Tanacetum cinerariifolium]